MAIVSWLESRDSRDAVRKGRHFQSVISQNNEHWNKVEWIMFLRGNTEGKEAVPGASNAPENPLFGLPPLWASELSHAQEKKQTLRIGIKLTHSSQE